MSGPPAGRWLYVLILLEFQSTVDRRMALRMMEYTAAIWKRLEADDLGPGGEYPFLLPVVIYNGEHRWTAPTDIGGLLAPAPDELLGYLPRLRYLLIEIQAEDPAALSPDNVLSMIARFEQAATAAALEELVRSLPDWLTRIRLPEFEEPFMAWATRVLTQRHRDRGKELQRKLRMEEEARMTTLIERARQWGEERDQEWMEKGMEKGIERGRTEGERELARRLARDRFGPGAAQELSRVLNEVPKTAEVPAIVKLIFECETAEEFLRRVREA